MGFFERSIFNLDLLEHLAGMIVLRELVTVVDRSVEELAEIRHKLVDDALGGPVGLFHREIFLLKLVKLSLEVEVFLFLHDLALFRDSLILVEKSLGLVMDEVTEDLEGVLLLDVLALK